MKNKLIGLSLFASAGIAEFGFEKSNIKIKLANELLPVRMNTHKFWHPQTETICGDITNEAVKNQIIEQSKKLGVNFVFATPPCQGVSLIGKNKSNDEMLADQRNFLIFHAFDIIDAINPDVILIENVARFLKIKFLIDNKLKSIEEIVREKFGSQYNIDCSTFDAADYEVPQHRERAIIRLWKNGYVWNTPTKQKQITLEEAIGNLPSLESGQSSNLKNHSARTHLQKHIECMKHTPTGHSAFENEFYFPKDEKTGRRLKGYAATYKRMSWNKPAPTVTMRNDAISSQSNVHPGRLLEDGTYSDARVLTLRELFIISSLNPDLDIPDFASDMQIRHIIGEAVPPRFIYNIVKGLKHE